MFNPTTRPTTSPGAKPLDPLPKNSTCKIKGGNKKGNGKKGGGRGEVIKAANGNGLAPSVVWQK